MTSVVARAVQRMDRGRHERSIVAPSVGRNMRNVRRFVEGIPWFSAADEDNNGRGQTDGGDDHEDGDVHADSPGLRARAAAPMSRATVPTPLTAPSTTYLSLSPTPNARPLTTRAARFTRPSTTKRSNQPASPAADRGPIRRRRSNRAHRNTFAGRARYESTRSGLNPERASTDRQAAGVHSRPRPMPTMKAH